MTLVYIFIGAAILGWFYFLFLIFGADMENQSK